MASIIYLYSTNRTEDVISDLDNLAIETMRGTVADMLHDLKQPTLAIEEILSSIDDENCQKDIEKIRSYLEIMRGVHQDVSLFFNNDDTEIKKIYVTNLYRDLHRTIRSLTEKPQVSFSKSIAISSGLRIHCRPYQVIRIVTNLVDNGIHAVSQMEDKWIRLQVLQVGIVSKLKLAIQAEVFLNRIDLGSLIAGSQQEKTGLAEAFLLRRKLQEKWAGIYI